MKPERCYIMLDNDAVLKLVRNQSCIGTIVERKTLKALGKIEVCP